MEKIDKWIDDHPIIFGVIGFVIYISAQLGFMALPFLIAQGIAAGIIK